ncbi:hypothetical protein L0244_04330 [bacterium]|nr:hypothetical protein [bacterium]
MQRIIICVFVIFFLNTTLFAESQDWQNVSKLRKGKTIYVMLNSGKWLTAKIEKVEDETLVVENGADRYEAFRRDEIQEIYIKRASIGKSILLGTAIVVGGALALDVAVEHGYSGEDKYMYTPFIVMYAAPIGAGLGYLHGITSQKKDLIYKSERRIAEDYEIGNISEPHLPQTQWLTKPASSIW